nr:MAG TPA: hypothetical protein [Caudoviricetes sp.]
MSKRRGIITFKASFEGFKIGLTRGYNEVTSFFIP